MANGRASTTNTPSTAVNAMADATCSLSAPITGATAAIAELPQIALETHGNLEHFFRREADSSIQRLRKRPQRSHDHPKENRYDEPLNGNVAECMILDVADTGRSKSDRSGGNEPAAICRARVNGTPLVCQRARKK